MEELDTEYLLLIPLLILGIAFTVDAFSYPPPARRIPLAISVPLTFLVAVVLLTKLAPHFASLVERFTTGGVDGVADAARAWLEDLVEAVGTTSEENLFSPNGYTVMGTIVFIVASYFLGLIVTAPVFLFIYMVASRVSVVVSLVVAGAAFGIIYFLMDSLHLYDFLGGVFF